MTNVLVTGAFGRVGTAIIDHLGDAPDYEFTYLDKEPHPAYDGVTADITNREAIEPAMEGQDAVVHLAGSPSTQTPWPAVLSNNIIGTYNVLAAADRAGVERVIFASTNHVVGMYRADQDPATRDAAGELSVDHTDPPRPDSYYAVSKLFGEHLGRYYVECEDDPERFYAIRIGWIQDREHDHPFGPAEAAVEAGRTSRGTEAYERRVRSCRSLWCSRRDFARLTECVLEDDSVTFDIFNARSGGTLQWLDMDHTRSVLGFEPIDDADAYDEPPS